MLDVGGGWGLFRRWWCMDDDALFIVHDPALERFLTGPTPLYPGLYGEALERPMTFAAGFGEELPYRDGVFDEFVCAAVLDHALDPRRVLAEGLRCLKPVGNVLVIVQCTGMAGGERTLLRPFGRRLLRAFRHPLRALKRLFGGAKDPHLHHFAEDGLKGLMASVGFTQIESRLYGVDSGARAFLARKPV
ncbi:methyltransferase domain-containing protein [bacterium]|nr:methyltransferase domain-containing protein [bacterium]